MVRVPTPIPESWAEQWRSYWRQALLDKIWQFFVITVIVTFILLVVAGGPGFLLASIIGMIISIILADDIRQTISDVWNRNFWVWRV